MRARAPCRPGCSSHPLAVCVRRQAKTVLLANVNPLHSNAHESLCTLRFACDVAKVATK